MDSQTFGHVSIKLLEAHRAMDPQSQIALNAWRHIAQQLANGQLVFVPKGEA